MRLPVAVYHPSEYDSVKKILGLYRLTCGGFLPRACLPCLGRYLFQGFVPALVRETEASNGKGKYAQRPAASTVVLPRVRKK